MANKFKGQVVWITGASSGIGAALAKEFIDEGAMVALSARRADRLHELAQSLGPNARVFLLDVQNKPMVDRVAEEIANELGKIDVVVANAGFLVLGPLLDLTEEMWRKQFETNVFGVVWTLQAAIPFLKNTKGRIAIMSSVAGKLAFGHGSAYSASKFALMGIANALYLELHKAGVSVTNIAPGLVESEIGSVDNLGRRKGESPKSKSMRASLTWPADKAAKEMVRAIHGRKRETVVTGHGKLAAFLGTHLPALTYWGMAKASLKRTVKGT